MVKATPPLPLAVKGMSFHIVKILQAKEGGTEESAKKAEETQKSEEKVKGLPSLGPRPKKKNAASEEGA